MRSEDVALSHSVAAQPGFQLLSLRKAGNDNGSVPVPRPFLQGNDRQTDKAAACRVVHDGSQFEAGLAQGEIGYFRQVVDTAKTYASYPLLIKGIEQREAVLAGNAIKLVVVAEVQIGEMALLGQTLGGEEISKTVARISLHLNEPLFHQGFQIRVDKPQGDAEAAGDLALRDRLALFQLGHEEERAEGVLVGFIGIVHEMNNR
jgi:hypothetical protein